MITLSYGIFKKKKKTNRKKKKRPDLWLSEMRAVGGWKRKKGGGVMRENWMKVVKSYKLIIR